MKGARISDLITSAEIQQWDYWNKKSLARSFMSRLLFSWMRYRPEITISRLSFHSMPMRIPLLNSGIKHWLSGFQVGATLCGNLKKGSARRKSSGDQLQSCVNQQQLKMFFLSFFLFAKRWKWTTLAQLHWQVRGNLVGWKFMNSSERLVIVFIRYKVRVVV